MEFAFTNDGKKENDVDVDVGEGGRKGSWTWRNSDNSELISFLKNIVVSPLRNIHWLGHCLVLLGNCQNITEILRLCDIL